MADREKVIADIEEQITWIRDNDFHKFPGWGHAVLAMQDALVLLKEQEPKPVSQIRTIAERMFGYCPSCGRGIDSYHDCNSGEHITHYCYNCGQAVKWNE